MNVSAKRWNVAQWFERKWWKNYLGKKDPVAYLDWKRKYWIEFYHQFRDIVPVEANALVLDAGCGPAGIFMIFTHQQTTAFDPLLEAYESDLPHFKKEMYPTVEFITSSLEDFKEKDKFDVVFCINAINHVKDIEGAIKQLVYSAKKGAKLIISIDAHNHKWLQPFFKLIPGDILHPHQFNLEEYIEMFEKCGIKTLRTICLKKEFVFNYHVVVGEKL